MHEKQEEIEKKQTEIKQVESEKKQAIKDGEAAEKEVVNMSKKRDAEMSKGGRLKQLQDDASRLGKVVAKIRTQAEIKVATIKDEEAKNKTYEARLEEVRVTRFVFCADYWPQSQLDASLIEKRNELEKVAATDEVALVRGFGYEWLDVFISIDKSFSWAVFAIAKR